MSISEFRSEDSTFFIVVTISDLEGLVSEQNLGPDAIVSSTTSGISIMVKLLTHFQYHSCLLMRD